MWDEDHATDPDQCSYRWVWMVTALVPSCWTLCYSYTQQSSQYSAWPNASSWEVDTGCVKRTATRFGCIFMDKILCLHEIVDAYTTGCAASRVHILPAGFQECIKIRNISTMLSERYRRAVRTMPHTDSLRPACISTQYVCLFEIRFLLCVSV